MTLENAAEVMPGVARNGRWGVLTACLVLGFIFWFFLFSPLTEVSRLVHGQYFWYGMTAATTTLGVLALALQRKELRRLFRFEPRHILWGIGHAIFLYGLSRFGVWLFSHFFSWVVPQIEAIYVTRYQLDPRIIALLLIALIAPFEEIFWRGFVLDRLFTVVPERMALIIAIGLYSFVHIWAFNPMLLLAALVLGAHWSLMYWKFKSLVPGLISHALWDAAIFVIFPIHF